MSRATAPGYLTAVSINEPDAEEYGDYSVDDETQLSAEDTLENPEQDVDDELDRGYSPREDWSAGQGFGNTPFEEATGETLEQLSLIHI